MAAADTVRTIKAILNPKYGPADSCSGWSPGSCPNAVTDPNPAGTRPTSRGSPAVSF
jgi:hypothetical protein